MLGAHRQLNQNTAAKPMTGSGDLHLHLISDSTGETLHALARAALAPFSSEVEVAIHLSVFVRTAQDLETALAGIRANPGLVWFTVVAISVTTANADGIVNPSPRLIDFDTQIMPLLTRHGCNAGSCHGAAIGRGGFKLSLLGSDAAADHDAITHALEGRRVNRFDADRSLLLLKPLMKVPHGGGMQIHTSDPAYEVIRTWISEGCQVDPDDSPKCVGIEILPPTGRVLKYPAHVQSLCVLATFSDGSVRDVTEMAVFSCSDTKVATVDASGLVVGQDRGEAAVIVRYLEFI